MEKHQDSASARTAGTQQPALYWEVTYLDADCGRVRTEAFDDAAQAERFASRYVHHQDGWAIVDALQVRAGRAAA
ncbi:hypothetical protein [Arthrobacter sp. Soil763]|uniref:hypothetical protein n=1 Tax=Arthrobacter sp. Soil763 TaxID=1736402 RepID=UPI0006FD271B|nr:hypothetical protein [Arthrobacter sp. Soil763]KRE81544.1 hypothetical protein ASG71_00170 [Arthrobacter sp. Soil763]